MNPDTVSPEVTRELQAAGWPQGNPHLVYWRGKRRGATWTTSPMPLPDLPSESIEYVAAPTIGELLEVCRRLPYEFRERVAAALMSGSEWSLHGEKERVEDCVLNFLCLVDSNTLGRAVAEAMKGAGDES